MPPTSPRTPTGWLPGPLGMVRQPALAPTTMVCTLMLVHGARLYVACIVVGQSIGFRACRWSLWVQECEPAPFLGHDVVRQPAPVQGWQGLRLVLPGTLLGPSTVSRMLTSLFVLSATLMKMETEIDREKTRLGMVWTKSFHLLLAFLPFSDKMPQPPCVLRKPGDGGDHRHELLPSLQVPL